MKELLILFLVSTNVIAQKQESTFNRYELKTKGTIEDESGTAMKSPADIFVIQNTDTIHRTQSAENGKYQLDFFVDLSKPFCIQYCKKGYVTKQISLDVSTLKNDMQERDKLPVYFLTADLSITMCLLRGTDKALTFEMATFSWDTNCLLIDQEHAKTQRKLLQAYLEKSVMD